MLGVLFVRSGDLMGRLIRVKTRSAWNHVALINYADGALIEAVRSGVVCRAWTGGDDVSAWIAGVSRDWAVPVPEISEEGARRGWEWAAMRVGRRYDYLAAAAIGFRAVTGLPWTAGAAGEYLCSELVAGALVAAGYPLRHEVAGITPGDLADELLGTRD